MDSYKFIILICFSVLFFGTNALAVKHSSQFPQEPKQTLPVNEQIYPVTEPSNTNSSVNQNTNHDNQNNLEELDQQTATAQSNPTNKKTATISGQAISFMIFFLCVLAVLFSFVLLKRKKVI
jgi:predicted PurR-regulated permease PerM